MVITVGPGSGGSHCFAAAPLRPSIFPEYTLDVSTERGYAFTTTADHNLVKLVPGP